MKINNPFQGYNRGYTARERRIRTKYGTLFFLTGLVCLWLGYKNYRSSAEIGRIQASNEVLVDSLQNELFIEQTNAGRYEIKLEHLREVDSAAAKVFEEYSVE